MCAPIAELPSNTSTMLLHGGVRKLPKRNGETYFLWIAATPVITDHNCICALSPPTLVIILLQHFLVKSRPSFGREFDTGIRGEEIAFIFYLFVQMLTNDLANSILLENSV